MVKNNKKVSSAVQLKMYEPSLKQSACMCVLSTVVLAFSSQNEEQIQKEQFRMQSTLSFIWFLEDYKMP